MIGSEYSLSVKGIPGTIQEGGAAFATTHWSVVAACTDESETGDAALARLCRDYWPPLYNFARFYSLHSKTTWPTPGIESEQPNVAGIMSSCCWMRRSMWLKLCMPANQALLH